jgi:RHH-type proline utilization regulon transcriptional repressor/proline dehydrogenase/delta 1-pyrroline-5-carboxylate dehydrogenase
VLWKPAASALLSGWYIFRLLEEAGLPPGVINFVPGDPREISQIALAHRDLAGIHFTGSTGVFDSLWKTVAGHVSDYRGYPRIVGETGGKDFIVAHPSADPESLAVAIARGGFEYQGQKCSAASRVILLSDVHDRFLSRLVDAVSSLKIGPPEDPRNAIGPVIDAEAQQRIAGYIELGKQEAKCVLEMTAPKEGFFVGPAIFRDVDSRCRIAQEEIFGPVLSVLKAPDFDQALQIASDSLFALTGGIFSRSPAHIEQARKEFRVGNLYINRGITGAVVERQPFGGLKLSGIGSKAGGPDYLLQFLEPRTISENTLRHGFAPPEREKK